MVEEVAPSLIEEKFRRACKKPEGKFKFSIKLGGESIPIDLSLTPDDVPLDDFPDYSGNRREGLLKQMANFLSLLEEGIDGKSDRFKLTSVQHLKKELAWAIDSKMWPSAAAAIGGVNYDRPKGWDTIFFQKGEKPESIIWDSKKDLAMKDLIFSALGKEKEPVVAIEDEEIDMKVYKAKKPINSSVDIYCMIVKRPQSDLTVYSLVLTRRGFDLKTLAA
ncbi:hypothetical protein HY439_01695 [Candidatus Microgenomates bacterium]|nr:hypothetical protein [Candidatus Microgenomates bacterium]